MRPGAQKWEYCLVLAHLEGSHVDKTVVLEKSPSASLRSEQPGWLGLSWPEVPVPRLMVLAINGKRPKEEFLSIYALASELGEQGVGAREYGTHYRTRRPDRERVGVQTAKTSEPLVIDNRRNDVGMDGHAHSTSFPWERPFEPPNSAEREKACRS
jgi:hypothetical protein